MNIRKKFSGQIIMVCMFLVFGIGSLVTGFIFQGVKFKEYKSQIATLNEQISETKAEKLKLKKVESSKDTNNIEYIARHRLNMVKPNEIVYIDTGREGN